MWISSSRNINIIVFFYCLFARIVYPRMSRFLSACEDLLPLCLPDGISFCLAPLQHVILPLDMLGHFTTYFYISSAIILFSHNRFYL